MINVEYIETNFYKNCKQNDEIINDIVETTTLKEKEALKGKNIDIDPEYILEDKKEYNDHSLIQEFENYIDTHSLTKKKQKRKKLK